MSRVFKFRYWQKESKEMTRIFDIKVKGDSYIHNPDVFIIMQFTGLKDKNGVDIYEGDIVISEVGIPVGCFEFIPVSNSVVVYNEKSASFCVDKGSLLPISLIVTDIEVVGNIHQNPELLK